jgi:3-deoxy-D-manno-octulosonate 8-phosphate phosphatase (KDO 8-P phosphatase)
MVYEDMISKIKIVVSEIDGIITEGLVPYDELCNVPFKQFYVKDFEAINEIKKGFIFSFLSSDNSISYHLCRKKNIPFFYDAKNKKRGLIKIMDKYNIISPEEVIFIGSSFSDLECIQFVPLSMCPEDSVGLVKEHSRIHLNSISGMGVLTEVAETLRLEILKRITQS